MNVEKIIDVPIPRTVEGIVNVRGPHYLRVRSRALHSQLQLPPTLHHRAHQHHIVVGAVANPHSDKDVCLGQI
eukprot:5375901-Amphidinium_carterae.1